MAKAKKLGLENPAPALDEEDQQTLRLSMKECGTLMPVELCPPRKSVAS